MKADKDSSSLTNTSKEVTVVRRLMLIAIVMGAFLVLAVPAFAWNGQRADYTTSDYCSICHQVGQPGSAPKVFDRWEMTKHAINEEGPSAAKSLPTGSVCAGCHTANYAPIKATPSPSGTAWVADPSVVTLPQSDATPADRPGDAPFSEDFIGCSSCHYGATTGTAPQYGNDPNDTAHMAPDASMANADICGACHSRYSYTTGTFAINPIPTPGAVSLIQPQMALGGYKMLGEPTAWVPPALSTALIVPSPGWVPAPTATTAAGLMTYWKLGGSDSMWQNKGHDGSAAQYPEWASEGHASSLTDLKAVMGPNPPASCLKCHSADYRIAKDGEKPTGAQAQYGITCVGCHTPHDAGTIRGTWDEAFDSQLVNNDELKGNGSNVCVECHNGELPVDTEASPGADIHHPMKETMDGYGAIDVAAFPSVHKGKCIQCHMPPTSISRGQTQLGGNHTFNIITPVEAVEASPIPVTTVTVKPTATPTVSGTPVATTTITVTQDSMPFSACSTCHSKTGPGAPAAQVVSTVTATPSPAAVPRLETVTIVQNANGTAVGNMAAGDKALWLQDTIDQRQEWTDAKLAEIHSIQDATAANWGYTATTGPPKKTAEQNARDALVLIPAAERTTSQTAFLKAYTNAMFVGSEGSRGIHNWDYSRMVVNTAMAEAKTASTGVVVRLPWVVTFKMSPTTVRSGTNVKFSGTVMTSRGVAGTGRVQIWRRVNGVWKVWQTTPPLNASGSYSLTVRVSAKGTFQQRAAMPADSNNLAGKSPGIRLVVN